MKKLLLILSLLASSILLVGCKTEKPESLHDSYMQTTSLQTTIGMEALTSAQILSNMDMGSDVKFGFNSSNPQKTSIDDIKPYIELFEQMLATNQGLEIVVAESDLEDYSYMITYHMQTLLNETTTLTIYYNIVNPTPIEDEELIDEPIVVEDETTETLSVGFNFNLNLDGETDDLDDDDVVVEDDEKELKFEIITETYAKKHALEYDFDDEPIIRIKFEFETIESNRKEVGMMRISIRYNDDESPYYDILISVGNSEFHENKDRGKSDSRGNQNPGKGNQNRL